MPRDRQEQLLAIIAVESQRLSRMIGQLLDLSRIEAGKMEWRLEMLDLAEVAALAAQTNRSLFDSKGIVLTLAAPGGKPQILADRDKIIQVLTNLPNWGLSRSRVPALVLRPGKSRPSSSDFARLGIL